MTGLAPMARYPVLRDEDVPAAAAIYAFDMAIQNPDRRGENPNCGYHAGQLVAFDFESAFSFRLGILNPDAWAVTRFGFRTRHVFYKSLTGKPVNWAVFGVSIKKLGGPALEAAYGTMPRSWQTPAKPIVDHVAALVEHADDFTEELGRSIT
jgi:hypothetical protein